MHLNIESFNKNYSMNLRYEDFCNGLYHQIKLGGEGALNDVKNVRFYHELMTISNIPDSLLADIERFPNDPMIVLCRKDKDLFRILKDGTQEKLWAFPNGQVPLEAVMQSVRNEKSKFF